MSKRLIGENQVICVKTPKVEKQVEIKGGKAIRLCLWRLA